MSTLRVHRPFVLTKLGQVSRLVWESHKQPMLGTSSKPVAIAPGELGVMFQGHSSFLLQFGACRDGVEAAGSLARPTPLVSVLVDPVFATRLVLLRRQRRPGIRVADLPAIDVVLLTHAHMDHLNRPTLRRIVRATVRRTGRAPICIVPRGVEDLVSTLGFAEVRSLEWWQQTEAAGLTITLTPAKHWGARMFSDTHRLFGGYVVAHASGQTVYHSGDTAYFDGFREIGRRLHPRVALLPIGAYFPDSYRAVHTSPEEALQAFVDVGAETMIPMHLGTFPLGREPMAEPPVRLGAEAARRGLSGRVRRLNEGESLVVAARE